MCCSVLQFVAVCSSVLQCVAVTLKHTHQDYEEQQGIDLSQFFESTKGKIKDEVRMCMYYSVL